MHELRHQLAGTMPPADVADPDIRILRRVSSLDDFPLAPRGEGPIRRVALVDVETTGTNPDTDELIDIAVIVLEVDAVGKIVGIASAGQALRDPGVPIPPLITQITGITCAGRRSIWIGSSTCWRVRTWAWRTTPSSTSPSSSI